MERPAEISESPTVPCPIDGHAPYRPYVTSQIGSDTFHIVRCGRCSLGIIFPQPSADVLNRYYTVQYYGEQSTKFIRIIQLLRRLSVEKKIRTIERMSRHVAGHVLDIGAADGAFLFAIKKRKWNTTGLEISDSFRTEADHRDINIIVGDLREQHFPDRQYNVVTLWHVFEHVGEPIEYLNEIRRVMNDDGLLVVTLPNIDSWQARLFGRRWFHLDPPRHLYHYAPSTLQRLFEQQGFNIRRIEHFSLEYNPYGYIQSFFNCIFSEPNALYDALRNIGGLKRFLRFPVMASLVMLPFVLLPAMLLSGLEAVFRSGGTIKVYADRAGRP